VQFNGNLMVGKAYTAMLDLWDSPDSVDTDQGFTGVSVRAVMNACS
jgi:hypothetical protein